MGKKTKTQVSSPQITTAPRCDAAKLRDDLSVYMSISSQLRAKRAEMYEADRCRSLKDKEALDMSVEVARLKRSSDKLRLSVCDQLRAYIAAVQADQSTELSLELANKCTELLHSITITAIKEEILQKERLLSNVRLHNGKSSMYVMLRRRWRSQVNMTTAEDMDQRADRFDGVREKLRTFIKFHDAIGYEIQQLERRSRDFEAEKLEVGQRLVSCLRFIAEVTADKDQNVSCQVVKQVFESAQCSRELSDAFNVQYANLHELFNNLLARHDLVLMQRDMLLRLVLIVMAMAVYQIVR
ncbi:Hypothetical protein PHPALM_15117 [Phytophthora palmivora]|uniref:Uncharacterized protein n=1 Tax=Phytophthora palmivora TaxID=4796 RepID=A0A2P4XT15_9STRA|nr:Hypothetical protein PHPALM_15117 [Phytophthora palmivora]